ncbi:MAG TPA: DUF3786 domain-containing protein, partial [Anaerolineae bacterium]|nr:DUF3786 domain-containing protein [Anaerolineae bacterium]
MEHKPRTPEETYGPALEKAREALPQVDPVRQAAHAGVSYEAQDGQAGRFQVPFFGTTYDVSWPAGEVRRANDGGEADVASRILLLHYLLTADGSATADRWIAFRNLPGGMGYDAAFQGRANLRLAQAFGSERAAFEAAARALKGESLSFGDASFLFRMLPRLWLAVVLYLADDE